MTGRDGFPGERPEHRMRKLPSSNRRITCASCRHFDGTAWCRRWNYHTAPEAPICDQYRPSGQAWIENVSRYSRGE
ncbi:MAG TPA: hypothetical protein VLW53_04810 [Candidatus Eisenbacteria bacterium]|nr:hypothetical protein [Candidatus Eisenbacteria bacterium]